MSRVIMYGQVDEPCLVPTLCRLREHVAQCLLSLCLMLVMRSVMCCVCAGVVLWSRESEVECHHVRPRRSSMLDSNTLYIAPKCCSMFLESLHDVLNASQGVLCSCGCGVVIPRV